MRYILLLGTLLLGMACQPRANRNLVKPQLRSITESVYASVEVVPLQSYLVQSGRSGVIKEIRVSEGDVVKKGDLLFTIQTSQVANRLVDAQLSLERARANYLGGDNLLTNLKLELATAKEKLVLDSTRYARQSRLWKQEIGTLAEWEQAQMTYEASSNQYQALQKRFTQTRQDLENTYKKAQNMVDTERSNLQDYDIQAEMDGFVYTVFKEVGEVINPQDRFAEIGSADQFILEMRIDEVDVTRIDIGDTAVVALEAYPQQVFIAKTKKINPKKDVATQTFIVEASFSEKPPQLYSGLSGEANIVVGRKQDALTIPAEYLMPGNQVETTDGIQEVVTGVKNMKYVEVLSGIDTTSSLLKPEADE